MRRREFFAVLGGAAAAIPLAPAAAQRRAVRIGWLVFGGATLGPIDQSLKDALVQRGLIEGRNIEIVHRHPDGLASPPPDLAAELVAQKPGLLRAVGGDVAKALFDASHGA